MLTYPHIYPILFQLGPLAIHWYGIMYLLGFLSAIFLSKRKVQQGRSPLTLEQIDQALLYGMLCVIFGGKIGYWLFYQPAAMIQNPLELISLWHPGMSFHGGVIGVFLALSGFAWKHKIHLIDITDFLLPVVPIGLGLGRIGNFINGEIWGKVTNLSIGMVFPDAGPFPRYPAQLIECLLEGLLLFIILAWISHRPLPRYRVSGAFLVCYAVFRIFAEFLREPDFEWGILAWNWLTMGQILCLPMLGIGIYFLIKSDLFKGAQS